ncbi:MAG TPA: hypothetical protein VIJ68_03515 [Candidatus Saccharimonadales bacterium]
MPERDPEAAVARARDAETILLPKNGNEVGAKDWLEKVADIEIPTFKPRALTAKSEGRYFRRLRDPEIVDGVQRGEGDVGYLGMDKFQTWKPRGLALEYVADVEGCDFILAALAENVDAVRARLDAREPVSVVTSHAAWLGDIALDRGWELNVRQVSGATEAFAEYVDMIADLRVTGNSLAANGLEEFMHLDSVHLGQLYREPVDTP